MSGLKRKNSWKKIKWASVVLFSLPVMNCTDVRLTPKADPPIIQKNTDAFCVHEPKLVIANTKFIFLVDKSGSNNSTDPGVQKRADNIARFIEENRGLGYFYALVGFSGNSGANYYIDNPKFTEDEDVALAGVANMRGDRDGGNTPYKAALGSAKGIILEDINLHPEEKNNYVVFFLSDGEPTDGRGPEINELVRDIIETRGAGRITLSTAFYGPYGNDSQDLLSEMAIAGDGKYVNFEESEKWDFNELINEDDVVPWKLKQFLIYNVNAAVCLRTDLTKGEPFIDTDSDGDGLCDRDEKRLNELYKDELAEEGIYFDPANRFSFGGGYGDAFHYLRVAIGKSLDRNCKDRSDEDHDLLTYCEELFIENNTPPDGIPGRADPELFDTDRDGIIDGIETFVYLPKGQFWALDNTNLEDSQDNEEDAREQIEQHRNPWERDKDITIPYDVTLRSEDLQGGKDCYTYRQSTLPLYPTLEVKEGNTLPGLEHKANENVVSVHYIQVHDNEPDSQGILMWKYQKILRDEVNTGLLGENAGIKIRDMNMYDPADRSKK